MQGQPGQAPPPEIDAQTLNAIQREIMVANFPLLVKLSRAAVPIYKKIESEDGGNKNDGSDRYFRWYCGVIFKKYLPHFQAQEASINNKIFQRYGVTKESYGYSVVQQCKAGNKPVGDLNKHMAESFKRAVFGGAPTVKANPAKFLTRAVYIDCLNKSHKDYLMSHCTLFEKVLKSGEPVDPSKNKRLFYALNWLSMYDHLSKHLVAAAGNEPLEWHPLNYFLLLRDQYEEKDPAVIKINDTYRKIHEKIQVACAQNGVNQGTIDALKQEIIATNP